MSQQLRQQLPSGKISYPIDKFKTSIALLTQGTTHELTEHHNVPQPLADIMVMQALFNQLDAQVDLPTMLVGPVIDAIRTSVENEHADMLTAMEEEAQ